MALFELGLRRAVAVSAALRKGGRREWPERGDGTGATVAGEAAAGLRRRVTGALLLTVRIPVLSSR